MLLDEKIELKMNNANIKHYRELGFIVKMGDTIEISTLQLSKGAHNKVNIVCDYCGETFPRTYKDYLNSIEKSPIKKDSCKKCRGKKTKESNMLTYGVESVRHLDEVNEKIKTTNIERYGVENPMGNKEIRDKATSTIIEKYGVDNFFKVPNFQEIQEKTMMERYGYKHPMENPESLRKSLEKRTITMYKNSSAPSSRQQRYIHDTVGGELNYPIDLLWLDLAFPDEMIYIEYQGSGHDLDIKLGKKTAKEFKQREINRYYYLKKSGWRMIEIISKKDYLPNKKALNDIIEFSKRYIKEFNSSYVGLYIDENKIKVNKETFDFNFNRDITYSSLKTTMT